MPGDPRIRASDADRDRAATLLQEHHAAGRITAEEFHERLDRAMTAKTLGELDELMADLPAIDLYELPDQALRRQRGRGGGRSRGRGGLPWGGALMASGEGPAGGGLGHPASSGGLPELSAGATALVAWATVALTLVLIGLVTGIAAGGLSAWWVLAAIPAGAISLIWLVIRRSRH